MLDGEPENEHYLACRAGLIWGIAVPPYILRLRRAIKLDLRTNHP
jgi:hypothetical protein